jgi:hypothetical protein
MNSFSDLVSELISIIDLAVPLVFSLTIVFLAWKVFDAWVINGGDAQKVESGKKIVVVGTIALVVMVGVWGLVRLLQASLGIG